MIGASWARHPSERERERGGHSIGGVVVFASECSGGGIGTRATLGGGIGTRATLGGGVQLAPPLGGGIGTRATLGGGIRPRATLTGQRVVVVSILRVASIVHLAPPHRSVILGGRIFSMMLFRFCIPIVSRVARGETLSDLLVGLLNNL